MAFTYTGTYTESTVDGDTVLVLTSSGDLTLTSDITADILWAAGGGGSSSRGDGGTGGAGEFLYRTDQEISAGTYSITVGGVEP